MSKEQSPLWQVVALTDYALPKGSQPAALRYSWRTLLQRLRTGQDTVAASTEESGDCWPALSALQRTSVAPRITWHAAAHALQQVLAEEAYPLALLVTPPGVDRRQILTQLAAALALEERLPPSREQILQEQLTWLGESWETTTPWVLIELERCFLRHTHGLTLLRALLGKALAGELGRGVIGCDSWAWAYLQHLFPLASVRPLTLQAFDGERLGSYLESAPLVSSSAIRFYDSESSKPLFSRASDQPESPLLVAKAVTQLAIHCRGNLAIAWHHWCHRLAAEPPTAEQAKAKAIADGLPDGTTPIWLAPERDKRRLPAEVGEEMLFLLHTLLLHNGLERDLLAELLPASDSTLTTLLLHLAALGVVQRDQELWRVAPLAYPEVRQLLATHSYLLDPF